MQLTAGWSVHTRTPGHASPAIGTGGYAISASPPVQISARARPAPKPPVASIPASMTRAPPESCRTATRSAAAFFAIASAICHARSLRPSSPPEALTPRPLQDLPFAQFGQITRVPLVLPGHVPICDRHPGATAQVAEQQPDVRWAVGAGVAERGRPIDRGERHDRPAFQETSGARPRLAEHDHRARDHPDAHPPSPIPGHGEHTAPHPRARLVADVPAHDDLAARHAARRAGRGAARIVPRVAAHVDPAARHREPQITTYAAVHRT